MKHQGSALSKRACAYAASGSDARMSGCEKPVIIVSGSGNQGISASVPVTFYAREPGCYTYLDQQKLLSDDGIVSKGAETRFTMWGSWPERECGRQTLPF